VTEVVIISGKGGTGKTSILGSFAALSGKSVLADCDVDAADLHLLLAPRETQREDFIAGWEASIDQDKCSACADCLDLCRFDAVVRENSRLRNGSDAFRIDAISCEGCGVCAHFCPEDAISMSQPKQGEVFLSQTRFGPMVHARLGIAAENSGKLVADVRRRARALAEQLAVDFLLVDGPPGTGCPVISSITGVDLAVIVAEPTLSGVHDMDRVVKLAKHFRIPAAVCINKFDLNESVADTIAAYCVRHDVILLGRVRYDRTFVDAQLQGCTVPECGPGGVADEVQAIWHHLIDAIRER
jgi:MinD superfamily P-loop ATPase